MAESAASFAADENPLQANGARRRGRIRVVFSIDNLGIGGTELNAVRTAERLDPERYQLTLITLKGSGPLRRRYERAGIEVVPFPLTTLFGPGTFRQGLRLARFLARERVDVFHSHDVYSNIFAVPWARIAGVPAVIASRRWWHSLPRRAHRLANSVAYRFAHCVLANSPAVARSVEESEGVRRQKIGVVYNFLDDDAFERPEQARCDVLRGHWGCDDRVLTIGIVARLSVEKDHGTLFRAIAKLRRRGRAVRLVIVGDGPERAELEVVARELGIGDMTTFAGLCPPKPNPHHLFDVSVLSSTSEAFPNSLLEAMAAEKPVVATRVGGTVDAVDDGITGFLVPPRAPEAMADALELLLRDAALRRRLGKAGRDRAARDFTAHHVLGVLQALYHRLLAC